VFTQVREVSHQQGTCK